MLSCKQIHSPAHVYRVTLFISVQQVKQFSEQVIVQVIVEAYSLFSYHGCFSSHISCRQWYILICHSLPDKANTGLRGYQPCQNVLAGSNFVPFSQLPATYSRLDFTKSPLVGKGTWHLLPTTPDMLPTATKHFDRAGIPWYKSAK